MGDPLVSLATSFIAGLGLRKGCPNKDLDPISNGLYFSFWFPFQTPQKGILKKTRAHLQWKAANNIVLLTHQGSDC